MKNLSWCVVIGSLTLSGAVAASPLDDFKEAAGRQFCSSIPYEGLRRTCIDKGREVDDWCKSSSRKITCTDLDPAGLVNKIENVKRKISDLKRERDELSSRLGSAKEDSERRDIEGKRKEKEDLIYELERKVDGWESQLSHEKSAVSDRIYNGERCVSYREEVAKIFAEAKSRARSESDPEIKPYAERIIAHWESEESGHDTAIRRYREVVEKCEQMR